VPTEVGYVYSKKYDIVGDDFVDRNDTDIPHLKTYDNHDKQNTRLSSTHSSMARLSNFLGLEINFCSITVFSGKTRMVF
jgi:hypothetical protein